MIRLEQCDPVLAAAIRDETGSLFECQTSRFFDRSRHFINRGLEGDTGRYFSLRHDAAPGLVRLWLSLLAPTVPDLELDQGYINVYPAGGFIPPHRDNTGEGHLAMAVVPLQSHPEQGLMWYEDSTLARGHFIPDQIGQAVIFDSLAIPHAVPPVAEPRFSIVYLYR
ncbi:2OG-Fe(II) oxygenase [Pseudomonas resinovorans]|uniref:2OG-Fe(II) oxygenase n=1 Tax=Metapseudomonas resinovorans TaxID=53412 RepID=A0ABT4Y6K4_METRE|nr:2OG-Fe(II) oxygenase [Pseudomonas resinovorans]MDA8484391.1 2OG-Fe(II) oxygenase [Pseudomonas resinovorans]